MKKFGRETYVDDFQVATIVCHTCVNISILITQSKKRSRQDENTWWSNYVLGHTEWNIITDIVAKI